MNANHGIAEQEAFQPRNRWLTYKDALDDQRDMACGKSMSRFILPGHPKYDDAVVGARIICTNTPAQGRPPLGEDVP